jgi:hypothetical protein
VTDRPGFRVTNGRSEYPAPTLGEALSYVTRQIERGYWDAYPVWKRVEIVIRDGDTGITEAVYQVEEAS